MSRRYDVRLTNPAAKELKRLPQRIRGQISQRLLDLELQPRPQDIKRMRGTAGDYRIDSGEYRILYELDDSTRAITVWRIAHRKDVYRNL